MSTNTQSEIESLSNDLLEQVKQAHSKSIAVCDEKITKMKEDVAYSQQVLMMIAKEEEKRKIKDHEPIYTITLTNKQANLLRNVLGLVGGSPYHSRRRISDEIMGVLNSLGAHGESNHDASGHIMFKDIE